MESARDQFLGTWEYYEFVSRSISVLFISGYNGITFFYFSYSLQVIQWHMNKTKSTRWMHNVYILGHLALSFSYSKYGFHNKSFFSKCTSGQLPNSSHPLWAGLLLHPPRVDDWNWATDQRCIQNKGLVMNPIL